MGVLLGVYYLLLHREKMHRFNRFYLLASLVFSMALPCISIPVYVEAEAMPQTVTMAPSIQTAIIAPAENINYWPYLLWGFYGLITLLLSIRFMLNIKRFYSVKKQSDTLSYKDATVVLLDEPVPPHTFFSNIFVSREDYENRHAEPELFTHELAHVNQHHTLDILFVEALKTLIWFNPLLHFYKRAIQLNHEFLADAATLSQHRNVTNYQSLLLGKSQPKLQFALASSINFSITKKRFIMMTKTTSKGKATLLKLASLPVLAGLVIALSTETIAQQPTMATKIVQQPKASIADRDEYYSGVRVIIEDKASGASIIKLYEELTEAEKDRYMFDVPARMLKKQPTAKELEGYKDKKTYAIWIDGKNVDNSILNDYKPEDFALHNGSFVHKNARTKMHPQQYQFNLYTHAYFDAHFTKFHYPGNTYKMNISKQFKDGVELKSSKTELTYPEGGKRISQVQDDTQPEYPGGLEVFYKLIYENVEIPADFNENIKIIVSFTVKADGSLSDIKILKSANESLSQAVIKAMGKSDKWTPGTKNGKAINTELVLPIVIKGN